METDIVTLAPGAGAGIGKLLADHLLSDPAFVPLMVSAAKDGLSASRSFWCGKGGEGYLETEPDMRIRIQTFALLLAHMEGEPIKRVIHEVRKASDVSEVLSSPAAVEAAERMIAGAKAKLRRAGVKTGPKQVEPVETEPASGGF